jgi:hypothetical protein
MNFFKKILVLGKYLHIIEVKTKNKRILQRVINKYEDI